MIAKFKGAQLPFYLSAKVGVFFALFPSGIPVVPSRIKHDYLFLCKFFNNTVLPMFRGTHFDAARKKNFRILRYGNFLRGFYLEHKRLRYNISILALS